MRSELSRRLSENPSSPVQGRPGSAMEHLAGPRSAARHPRTHSALLEIKVSGSLFGVIRQVQSLQKLEDKPFQYRISGSLSRPNSLFNLPFNESGEIDLRLPVNPY
ncbi:MAG: hypothetical protein KZQ99_19915 [Candidatus Thiodiazotropha sp. (ex Dulcina madagascariensis)]|nr:hypothetical protein [Candidatus Thiodiazotropha sp. (ex Dulcina madagascariensis)]